MIATLYVPYSNGDCVNGFRYDKDPISKQQYIKLMETEYNKYRNQIDTTVRTSLSHNMSINRFQKLSNKYKAQTFYYNECDCKVYDIKGNDCQIDELIHYFRTGEEFVIKIDVGNLLKTPDVETDLRMWINESNKIHTSRRLTEEEKLIHLPKKDFKMKFRKEGSMAILKDCQLLESYSYSNFAILVKEIIFVKES